MTRGALKQGVKVVCPEADTALSILWGNQVGTGALLLSLTGVLGFVKHVLVLVIVQQGPVVELLDDGPVKLGHTGLWARVPG